MIQKEHFFAPIADGLATDSFSLIEHFYSPAECEILRTELFNDKQRNAFHQAGIGNKQQLTINETIRGDYIQWLSHEQATPAVQAYMQCVEDMMAFLRRDLFIGVRALELFAAVYPVGSFYKKHIDRFRDNNRRVLTIILYLNKNWKEEDGGQLRMYSGNTSRDIFPTEGKLICFRSDEVEHEVLPAHRERLSLTGWMLDGIK